MIETVYFTKTEAENIEHYRVMLLAGKNLLVAEGIGRAGAETERNFYGAENEVFNMLLQKINESKKRQ
jgi:hypothetical protein